MTHTRLCVPSVPSNMVLKTVIGFSLVTIIVTIEQTMSASRIAAPRISHAFHAGSPDRFEICSILFTSPDLGHQETDLFLGDGTAVHDAGHLAAAKHQDAVAKLQKNVQILADIDDGDAFHLLLGQ